MVPALALTPAVFLSMSRHNFPLQLRDNWVLACGVLIGATVGWTFWLGATLDLDSSLAYPIGWIAPPVISTTALVIVGAWRAVRDAAVDAVDEDVTAHKSS